MKVGMLIHTYAPQMVLVGFKQNLGPFVGVIFSMNSHQNRRLKMSSAWEPYLKDQARDLVVPSMALNTSITVKKCVLREEEW